MMTRPWSPEHVLTPEQARLLVEAAFPRLAPAAVQALGVGFDNTAFRVNGEYVFRFPRRQVAVPLIEAETRLLPMIAPRLPLAVPVPVLNGRPMAGYPWPWSGYRMIPGRTACAAAPDDAARAATAEPLARFLAALHAVPADLAAGAGAGPDTWRRLDLAHRRPQAQDNLRRLAGRGVVQDPGPLQRILDGAPAAYVPRGDTLVHGDLYVRHLLVDSDNRLTGVIDWGDAHLGDPAVDLAVAHTFLPPAAHAVFRRCYGVIDDRTWAVARLRGLCHTLLVLVYAAETGDADLVREGQATLRYLAAG
jgi:aminoglycoside phosphotransferase (APT) family kinase protein